MCVLPAPASCLRQLVYVGTHQPVHACHQKGSPAPLQDASLRSIPNNWRSTFLLKMCPSACLGRRAPKRAPVPRGRKAAASSARAAGGDSDGSDNSDGVRMHVEGPVRCSCSKQARAADGRLSSLHAAGENAACAVHAAAGGRDRRLRALQRPGARCGGAAAAHAWRGGQGTPAAGCRG